VGSSGAAVDVGGVLAHPFVGCLLRYGAHIRKGSGEAPEELVIADRWLLLAGGTWMVLFALGVHAAG